MAEQLRRLEQLERHRRRGEVPCPICGVTVHPQLRCGDGRIVNYCSPANTNGGAL